jgi:tellurite resistance protein TerC
LIITGLRMIVAPDKGLTPDKNPLIRLFRSVVRVTPDLHGQRFFVRIRCGAVPGGRHGWLSSQTH